jgi:hypothetical protein
MGTKRQETFRIGILLGKSYTTIGTSSHGSVSLFWWQVSSVLDPILSRMIDRLAQSDCIHLKFQDHRSYQLTFKNLGDRGFIFSCGSDIADEDSGDGSLQRRIVQSHSLEIEAVSSILSATITRSMQLTCWP